MTTLIENCEKLQKNSESNIFGASEILGYIKSHLDNPTSATLSIKEVVPSRFYRVNYWQPRQDTDSIVGSHTIVDSKFIEIVCTKSGIEMIDITNKRKS